MPSFTLKKEERIYKRAEQECLFSAKGHSIMQFPIRAIYFQKEREEREPYVKVMVSVPKKSFKRAVKRNRVKRQLREAFRLLKHHLIESMEQQSNKCLLIALIWTDRKIFPFAEVSKKVEKLLCRLSEVVTSQYAEQ